MPEKVYMLFQQDTDFWNAYMAAQEIAILVADRFICIQICEEGYDYSIYDEAYRLLDGGIYDDTAISITDALREVVEELLLDEYTCGRVQNDSSISVLDCEDFKEKVAEMEECQIEEYLHRRQENN